MQRRAWIDVSPLETRGVVEIAGRPEHLLIEREGEPAFARFGARYSGRVTATSPRGGFVDIGDGPAGWIGASPRLAQGARVLVEVVAEARADKGPRLRFVQGADLPPGLVEPAPTLEATLGALAGGPGWTIGRGVEAREAADVAQEAALAVVHSFASGLRLAVEPTRALVAVDVDVDPALGASARRGLDLRAIRHAARLVRLKSLAGTIVIDIAGLRPAPGPLRAQSLDAFEPDGPQVRVWPLAGPGLLMVSKPHGRRPIAERLLDPHGRPTARTRAAQVLRSLEREAACDPGARFRIDAPRPFAAALAPGLARMGPRFLLRETLGGEPLEADIVRL